MQARRLPAIRGWNWIVEGFRLFRSNPALLTFLVFGYWLTLIFLNLVPLAMAVWFAPALVVFRNVAPLEAMKASFFACLKNIVPFLVYGVILFVLCIVAMIPFGLGMLVMMPVMMGSVYASYVEIFE